MGAVIDIDESRLPAALDKLERKIKLAVARGALAGAHRGRAVMVKRTPTDQGQLRAGWKVTTGTAVSGVDGGTLATLTNGAPHIAVVELGARPHAMSPEGWQAIYDWVRRHYRGGALGGTGKMRPQPRNSAGQLSSGAGPFHGPDPVISQVTNAIVHKIAKVGQKPTLFVKNSLDELRKVMIEEIELAMARVAGDA